jgi:hypothetical protein
MIFIIFGSWIVGAILFYVAQKQEQKTLRILLTDIHITPSPNTHSSAMIG